MNTESLSLLSLKEKGPDELMKQEPMNDNQFLDMIQKHCIQYFWDEANPKTGIVKDRASNVGKDNTMIGSSSATGFGITALIIAQKRGWLKKEDVYNRIHTTLKFALERMYHKNGFLYHFMDLSTGDAGKTTWKSEISSMDTALFLMGILFAGEYYKGTEIEILANELFTRVNWQWMCNGQKFLSMGYKPSTDALITFYCWRFYNEGLIANMLAIGSPTFPISVDAWHDMERPVGYYKGYKCIACSPLFTHQYPNLWIDFRNKHDGHADYFENGRVATLANRQYCIARMNKYKTYGPNVWGLTACDGPDEYSAFGSLPGAPFDDGSIAPAGAGGSFMFTPQESLSALKYMYYTYKPLLWGKYGFCDAFNVDRDWHADNVIGIDLGAMALAIENYRTGFVWDTFMKNPYIQNSLNRIGFKVKPHKDPSSIISLEGTWRYSTSDDASPVEAHYDDSTWDEISVPVPWEETSSSHSLQSIACYRKSFVIPEKLQSTWNGKNIVIHMGTVNNYDMVFFNGIKIGGKKGFRNIPRDTQPTILTEDIDIDSGWQTLADEGGSQCSISNVPGKKHKALSMEFDIGTGAWMIVTKIGLRDFSGFSKVKFYVKYEGTPNIFELKLVDKDDSTFGYKEEIHATGDWQLVEVGIADFNHWWGGNDELDLQHLRKIEIAISKKTAGKGSLCIEEIEYVFDPHVNIDPSWKQERVYRIPYNLIKFGQENVVSVKVFKGSICAQPVRIAPLDYIQYEPLKLKV